MACFLKSRLLNICQPTTNHDADLSYHILHLLLLEKFLLTFSDPASINTDCSCHLRCIRSLTGSGLPRKGEVWALAECHNACFGEALSCALSKLDPEFKDVQVFPSFLVKRTESISKAICEFKVIPINVQMEFSLPNGL